MSDAPVFLPANDLERVLLRAKAGQAPISDLVDAMLRSQLALLVDKEVGPEGWDNSSNPLILATHEGGPDVCVFTAVERARIWLERFPKFEWAVTADFTWLLKGVQPGTAVLVNPGWEEGLILRAETVQELRRGVETAEAAQNAP